MPAQQAQWQIPSPPSTLDPYTLDRFVDLDGDGWRDLLLNANLNAGGTSWQLAIQILSGADGSVLQTFPMQAWFQRAFYLGDINGDGEPEVAIRRGTFAMPGVLTLEVVSLPSQTSLWSQTGPAAAFYGWAVLSGLDVNADGLPDVITTTSDSNDSRVFVYDNSGAPLYELQMSGVYGVAISLASLGDRDGDGADDFLVGVNEGLYGKVLLVSGMTGAILRISQGLQPGDKTCDFVSNVGDLDGDDVPDYAAFPWITGGLSVVVWSGQTGQVIRTWPEFGNSVITGEDVDQDGVPDIVIGADWQVTTSPPHRYGSTRAYSGRDGGLLWKVDNLPVISSSSGTNGGNGWMEYSASLGTPPNSPYPAIAWLDLNWAQAGSYSGRIRGFRTDYAGQFEVTGTACSTTGEMPLIGVRQTQPTIPSTYPMHTRITVAKGSPGGAAWLNLDYASAQTFGGVPLPIDLAGYGLVGCEMYVGPTAGALRALGTMGLDRGYAQVELPRPLSPSSLGTALVAQWLLFDPATLDYGATQRHRFTL